MGSTVPLGFIIINKFMYIMSFKLIKDRSYFIWQIYNLCYSKIFFKIKITDYRDETDKNENYIFLPNHHSSLDGVLFFLTYPFKVVTVIKHTLLYVPFLGQCFYFLNFIFVDRRKTNNLITIISSRIAKSKESILIFPEGTRNYKPNSLKKLHLGAFIIASETGVPIVPIYFDTINKINDKLYSVKFNQVINIIIGKPIITSNKTVEELMNEYKQFYIKEGVEIT